MKTISVKKILIFWKQEFKKNEKPPRYFKNQHLEISEMTGAISLVWTKSDYAMYKGTEN